MTSEQSRKLFGKFVSKWNNGLLKKVSVESGVLSRTGGGVPLPFISPLVPSKSLGMAKGSLVSWPQQCLLLAPEIEAS